MISYSTEFNVDEKNSIEDVLNLACEWISGSPHSDINLDDLRGVLLMQEGSYKYKSESIYTGYASSSDYEIGGLRYIKIEDEKNEWTTSIVSTKTASEQLVSIQVSCESLGTASYLPSSKKPYFVKQAIERLGGGMDGEIPVSDKPIFLQAGDEAVAAQLILGDGRNNLPLIYISAGFDGKYVINEEKMARWLAGMAHVIVEPDYGFSKNLKDICDFRNVYGGTVGVYWPDSAERKKYFLTDDIKSPAELQQIIIRDVRNALTNRRPKSYCTWLNLKDVIARQKYERLKVDGSTEIGKYIEVFDAEIQSKHKKLEEAEREIDRLNAELRQYSLSTPGEGGGVLSAGDEHEFYPDEVKSFVLEILMNAQKQALEDSRRSHILSDLVKHNKAAETRSRHREEIKAIFSASGDIDSKSRSSLVALGFSVSEDGKHHKIVFRGDGRYTFSVSKTSSDHRAGKNTASDINKKLFL